MHMHRHMHMCEYPADVLNRNLEKQKIPFVTFFGDYEIIILMEKYCATQHVSLGT